jgi:hypothetical protein
MREQRSALPDPASRQQLTDSPTERSLRARLAVHTLHARRDSRQTTAKGRAEFLARFEREVDPDGVLDPTERRRRADHARRAYFTRLSLAAVAAKRARRAVQVGGDLG